MRTQQILFEANKIARNPALTLKIKAEQLKALTDHCTKRVELSIVLEAARLAAAQEKATA